MGKSVMWKVSGGRVIGVDIVSGGKVSDVESQ